MAFILVLGMEVLSRYLSDQQLRAQVLSLASEITAFADEQNRQMPQEGKPNWDAYTRRLAQINQEALALYSQRYAIRLAFARKEFARRGLHDENLDKFYQRPETPMIINAVAERLRFLANQLR